MRFLGNILWFIFGGWYLALSWLFGALIFAITPNEVKIIPISLIKKNLCQILIDYNNGGTTTTQ